MHRISDLNVESTMQLPTPSELKDLLPVSETVGDTVYQGRTEVTDILEGRDKRLLVIAGPCSIHDPEAAIEYAKLIADARQRFSETLCIVMRVYFEKPRTTIGWKGLIYDPDLNGSDQINNGLRIGRELLLKINELGVPCASEFLDPVVPQYIADLISWAAIGARTTESQTHREMCSGLSMPVGFKNGTDGNLQIAIDAMVSARHPHTFLGVDQQGVSSLVRTKGNAHAHIVLRGGRERPNYDEVSLEQIKQSLEKAGEKGVIIVDCSHANSFKKHDLQPKVMESVVGQRIRGNADLVGVMLESNLKAGSQPMSGSKDGLEYGVSITDACIDWETTLDLLEKTAEQLS